MREKQTFQQVAGLEYYPDFITEEEEKSLITKIDMSEWNLALKRRTQHYGYLYDYKARKISPDSYLGQLPEWLLEYGSRLYDLGIMKSAPDQTIINDYQVGQGIASHTDCEPCFTDEIASLTLISGVTMRLFEINDKNNFIDIFLEPRSLLVISGDARYKWKHGIAARKTDIVDGIKIPRKRRVSLTYRKVI